MEEEQADHRSARDVVREIEASKQAVRSSLGKETKEVLIEALVRHFGYLDREIFEEAMGRARLFAKARRLDAEIEAAEGALNRAQLGRGTALLARLARLEAERMRLFSRGE